MKKPELLSPAGNLENLKVAFAYGADAVYLSGKKYGLRARADNFTLDEIKEGTTFAHSLGKRVYVTLNIFAHNEDLIGLNKYIKTLEKIKIDGVIVSDPGIISIVKETSPELPIHLSTQANTTNYQSALFWNSLGIKRITLARELSLKEIQSIVQKASKKIQLEVFVHGSMCISYSGRCMLSSYMIGRDANRGDCAQPCRWVYKLEEEKRPGEHQTVFEDERGTYIFNSKDLCLIKQLPELIKAGVNSFKIEGRMKSSYYVAVVTSTYRKAIDTYFKSPKNYKTNPKLVEELNKINCRNYTTGFFSSKPGPNDYVYDSTGYTHPYSYTGLVLDYNKKTKFATVLQHNKMVLGDKIEVIGPNRSFFTQKLEVMFDKKDKPISSAPHTKMIVKIRMTSPVKPLDMLRKKLK